MVALLRSKNSVTKTHTKDFTEKVVMTYLLH